MADDRSSDMTVPHQRNSESPPLVLNWDRYEIQELLGEGAMGQVYRAYDPRLKRWVAIKFILNGSPASIRRFLQEAQAQARLQHENVCEVYEVGEVEGKHYVCMQYIEGRTLKDCQDSLTVDQKIQMILQVAEAIHEAHRLGLIHRDIKPSNIMVEQKEGLIRSYVLDFGLVRELQSQTLTRTGEVLGTPAYMSPEQAAGGELGKLDRRTDIYSLGASLYEILARRPAFEGTPIDILIQVLEKDPLPLRKINPKVPKDLETIVMKCMEKEPHRRYDSARALAEDLKRYLDGESISATPVSFASKFLRKAKRHKTTTSLLSIALLLVLLFSSISFYTQQQSARRAILAQQFGQQVQKIESMLRNSYTLPLHDVRNEITAVRQEVKHIESQMQGLGRIAEGPGNYALGRGYLLLGEYDLALQHLQKAVNAEYEPPEVSYALGQTYGYLYLNALRDTSRIKLQLLREARRKQNERDFRLQALTYLKQGSRAFIDSPSYVEGMIAFHEKNYELALEKAEQAFREVHWLYEAKKLEGDILVTRATARQNSGDAAGASEDMERAGKAYQLAMEVGRSDPAVYESECNRLVQSLHNAVRRGESGEPLFQQMRGACDQALRVNPENGEVYKGLASAYWRWADQRRNLEDPTSLLQQAITYSKEAIRQLPDDDYPHDLLACAYWVQALVDESREIDPGASVLAAEKAALQGIKINPNSADCYNTMGNAISILSNYEIEHGRDPTRSFERTVSAYENAIRIDPNYAYVYNNIGNIHYRMGRYAWAKGSDPISSFKKAIDSYQKAIQSTKSYAHVFYNGLGSTYNQLAQYETEKGRDPTNSINMAVDALNKSIQISPQSSSAVLNLGLAHWSRGIYESLTGKDPTKSFAASIDQYQKAIELAPEDDVCYKTLAHSYLDLAEYHIDQGVDPQKQIDLGLAAIQRALQLAPNDFESLRNGGRLQLAAAKWAIHSKRSPETFLTAAENSLKAASQSNSNGDGAVEGLAEVYLNSAKWKWSRKQNPETDIQKGFETVEKAIQMNRKNGEAFGVRAELYLLQAEMTNGKDRREHAESALKNLQTAIEINPLLKTDYKAKLLEAEKLKSAGL